MPRFKNPFRSQQTDPPPVPPEELTAQQETEQAGAFFDGRLLTDEHQSAKANAWPAKIEIGSLTASGGDTNAGGEVRTYNFQNAWPKSYEVSDSPSTMADLAAGAEVTAPAADPGDVADDLPEGGEDLLDL